MPASITMKLTIAQADVSARVPKSRTRAHTSVPMTSAVRKQPRRNRKSERGPPPTKLKLNAQVPITAMRVKTSNPRPMPTNHAPNVKWWMRIGLRNWCFIDFPQMSNSIAYATSSWQTCTADSEIVPTRMNDVICGVRSRKRVSKPCESIATPGQNVSSKTKKTFRRAMIRSRWANASVRVHPSSRASSPDLNEAPLEFGLRDLAVPHQYGALVQPSQDLRQPLFRRIDGALDALPAHVELEHAR